MTDKTGGPAFPQAVMNDEGEIYYFHDWHGMSLRDYFAAKAMAAAMSKTELNGRSLDDIATGAYKSADAMLKARDQ